MKLTILGNYGPFPAVGGACSSYLLQLDSGENIVLDMGSGSLAQLQKYICLTDMDAVILSHLHFDHIADALFLRYALNHYAGQGAPSKKIKLFLPKSPENIASLLVEDSPYQVHFLEDGYTVALGGATFTFMPMQHPVETYGVQVKENSKIFAYTGDTALHEGLRALLQNADVALVEAGELETQKAATGGAHLSVQQACEVAKQAGVRQLVLTHTMPLYEREALLEKANGRGVFAQSGQIYTI